MKKNILPLLLILALSGRANLISNFDQNSYDSAMDLKARSMTLIEKTDEPASMHNLEITELEAKLTAQLAYEQGKGKSNNLSCKQWEILIATDGNLLGKLLSDWKQAKPMSKPYLVEKRIQIGDAFDEILNLEGAKTK